MKNQTIEKVVLSILALGTGYLLYGHIELSYVLLYNLVGHAWMWAFIVYVGMLWVGNPEVKRRFVNAWSFIGLTLIGWVFVNFFYVIYLHDKFPENPLNLWHIFHHYYIDNYLEFSVPGMILGFIYGLCRRMIQKGNAKKLKKILGWSSAALVSAAMIFGVIYWSDVQYDGNQSIKFLDKDQEFTSLEEVLSQPELKGKKVFVDVWFSTCGPCISAFKNKDAGKELLTANDYVFLYLAREISQPTSKQHWINTIKDYDLQGYHVYMSEDLNNEVINEVSKRIDRYFGYPHYMIINKEGEVVEWDAPDVTDVEGLKKVITS